MLPLSRLHVNAGSSKVHLDVPVLTIRIRLPKVHIWKEKYFTAKKDDSTT
jgi:hypothetical protein